MSLHAIVLAAGKGTRMKSELAKVLHVAAGRPLVRWMLDTLESLGIDETVVVVGHQAEEVTRILPPTARTAFQSEQLGTGHAAQIGLAAIDIEPGDIVVIVPGDMPLISVTTIRRMLELHASQGAAATLVSAVPDPTPAFGRVVRDDEGAVVAIVEERDASPEQRAIREVNTSVYAFDAVLLTQALSELHTDNDQGELYLTDVIGILAEHGHRLAAFTIDDSAEALGINTLGELAEVSALLGRDRASGEGPIEPGKRYSP